MFTTEASTHGRMRYQSPQWKGKGRKALRNGRRADEAEPPSECLPISETVIFQNVSLLFTQEAGPQTVGEGKFHAFNFQLIVVT